MFTRRYWLEKESGLEYQLQPL